MEDHEIPAFLRHPHIRRWLTPFYRTPGSIVNIRHPRIHGYRVKPYFPNNVRGMLWKRQVYNQRAFVQSKAEGKFPRNWNYLLLMTC